jgi:Zn-dependent protease
MTDTKPSTTSKFVNILLLSFKVLTKILAFSAKLTKFALAGISFAAYSYMYSWKFSLILMVQLFIHESGHIWAMKKVGIKTKGIYFIPFVGGAAVASEAFKTRRDEVFVAIMGPIFGFGCALAMMIVYYYTQDPMYAAGASWMAMINLFNLLPINPLDGGRIMKSIAFSLNSWIGLVFMGIGIIGSIFLAFFAHIWIFIVVVIISSLEFALEIYYFRKEKRLEEKNKQQKIIDEWKKTRYEHNIPFAKIEDDEPKSKPGMSVPDIIISAVAYFALAFMLYWFMASTMHIPGAAMAMEMLT